MPAITDHSIHPAVTLVNVPVEHPGESRLLHPNLFLTLIQQLDIVKLPSTPPQRNLPPDGLSPDTTFQPTPNGVLTGYTNTTDTGPRACGLKAPTDVWLSDSSPPSPSTLDSTYDSQPGAYFPRSDHSSGSDDLPSRRHGLSLNIPNFSAYQPSQNTPSTFASSGAPFTDNSFQSFNPGVDYFQLEDLPSGPETTIQPQIVQPPYRLPASQPSSPVRGVFPQGQVSANLGRARGATFSGSGQGFDFSPYQQPFASALPQHLAFTSIQSPIASPLNASPLLSASAGQEFFGAINGEAVAESVPIVQPLPVNINQVVQPEPIEMPVELVDKLTLLDK